RRPWWLGQANCLKASERGHFISSVPTSQKSWRNRRVLLSGDWESPSGVRPRFPVPTTFQTAGKIKQPIPTQSEVRQVDRVRLKVPAAERVYPRFLFTDNLIRARLINPAESCRGQEDERIFEAAPYDGPREEEEEAARGPCRSARDGSEDVVLSERLRQLGSEAAARPTAEGQVTRQPDADAAASRAAGKRPVMVDLEASPASKRSRPSEASRAVFAAEDEDGPTEAVTIACPSKTVQFVNHMILGSQMELPEVDELPKKLLREQAGRAFRLQAAASMEMWLCVKRAISAAEKAKRAYDDGRAKVAEAGKAIQAHAQLLKEKEAAERRALASEAMAGEARADLEAVRAALEAARAAARDAEAESERTKAAEVEAAVQAAIQGYRSSKEFAALLDGEVGSEMADMLYRFKRYNPGQKLNLNFAADPPPLPEGMTEDMIEDYDGETLLRPLLRGPGSAEAAAGTKPPPGPKPPPE
ncbi:hypothetical protein Prudu_903S000100, partial [Prunus dulcis]